MLDFPLGAGLHGVSRRFAAAAVVAAYILGRVEAHEHHDEKIPEGAAVSPEPIVRDPF